MGNEPSATPAAPGTTSQRHPIGFWFIFCGELAERSCFYGMKAILLYYLIHVFGYKKDDATTVFHVFVAACYFAPLLGGFIADRYFGKYWTIVGFSIPYIIGQVAIGMSIEYLVFGAMALLALGSGVIKPNVSTLMGLTYDQQRPGNDLLRTRAFSYYYMAINIGSALSTLICPALRDHFGKMDSNGVPADPKTGYLVAFMFPAVLMVVALGFFAAGRKYYAVEVIDRSPGTPEQTAAKWKVVGRVAGLFFLIMFFWAIFDQHASTWVLFAKEYLDLNVMGYRLAPEQIQALNPIFIVLFVPIMNWIYAILARKGYKIRATDKMIVGFVLTALCMAIHAVAGYVAVQSDGSIQKVSILWQVLAFVVITIAEILISVTGLELAFTAAPKSMQGFVTALWLVTVGLANLLIDAPVGRLYPSSEPGYHLPTAYAYFGFLTAMMLVVIVAFAFVAKRFNRTAAEPTPDETRRDIAAAE